MAYFASMLQHASSSSGHQPPVPSTVWDIDVTLLEAPFCSVLLQLLTNWEGIRLQVPYDNGSQRGPGSSSDETSPSIVGRRGRIPNSILEIAGVCPNPDCL